MIGALDFAASAYADAARTLEGSLAEMRAQWDDAARSTFDSQHVDPLLAHAKRSATELTQIAQELNAAARLLANSA
jgi:uncharacterized protein YukE